MDSIFSSLTIADQKRIAIVLLLILANFVFAVIGALVRGGFDPAKGGFDYKKFPLFFTQQVLPYVVGLAIFEAFLHVLPPSDMAETLTAPAASPLLAPIVPQPNPFAWLDPTALWTVYGSMVSLLLVSLSKNLSYLFGRGLDAAQAAAKK